ncbi:hypothetical protein GGI20_003230 [Coemansia sp. BCRC 34301]|nr:hypothetical protein GGI20_003230 [Coemansia sp. BCRC 34301]
MDCNNGSKRAVEDDVGQQQQQIPGLYIGDLDTSGTFPFPLGDQASLFNFHTPAGLGGLGSLYANMGNEGAGSSSSNAALNMGFNMLNNVLYDIGGIQQIDGVYQGTQIVADDMGMALGADDAGFSPSTSVATGRIDQACRMCRRRKVKCDGARPTCTFCQTKGFECAYEPAAAAAAAAGGARKRRKRQAGSESQGGSSSIASLAEAAAAAAAAAEAAAMSDSDDESSSSGNGLDALSQRQIAMPDSEDAVVSGEADIVSDSQYLEWYFSYFHPQQPILHRPTFERAVRSGTASRVLWLAVRAIAARYGPARAGERAFEYGRQFADQARAELAHSTSASLAVMQAAYLVAVFLFGIGDWVGGSSYWGTAARMFSQQQLHALDEAYQLPAFTSHLGLHESAVSPLTCRQSPAHCAAAIRRPALSSSDWIEREQQRRLRWALFDAERTHTLAGGSPPLVTLDAGWVHMPCSDSLWDSSSPRRAAEHERLLLHMGRYYVDSGGSLRIDAGATPNRVASMLVRVRRRKNRMHLRAHTAVIVGQLARTRLALFRLFFPSRWPSQLMEGSGPSGPSGPSTSGPASPPLPWDDRLRRARAAVSEIDDKLAQWRVYLESMFPLRDHEDGSGASPAADAAIRAERVEYANHRLLLATLLAQNRAVLLQLHACLERRARHLASPLVRPNQPPNACMRALRRLARESWAVAVRQACEVADLLQSHWLVAAPADSRLRLLVRPDWHARAAIGAKLNADANLRRFPPDPESGQRRPEQTADATVFFSHKTPPHPLLIANRRLLDQIVRSAAKYCPSDAGAELSLACSMNANIHIETNANAAKPGPDKSSANSAPPDFAVDDSADYMDPFRRQLPGTSYYIFVAAKTLIMYLHHAKMSAYVLARRNSCSSTASALLPSESVSIDGDHHHHHPDTRPCALPDFSAYPPVDNDDADNDAEFANDLSPPPELRTLADIRHMQDRLEVVMTALRLSQRHWMPVDYFTLCARKIRNMSLYGPWSSDDPVSNDPLAELAISTTTTTNSFQR